MDLLIRDVPPIIVKTIEEMAKKSGYKSREAYLRARIEQMATLSIVEETEDKYAELVNILLNVVKENTKLLEKFNF